MPTDAESNWANQLTMGIIKIQYKIEDAKGKVDTKNNEEVRNEYQRALKATQEARTAIHRFVGAYNNR
jgi:hypothetical protein